MWTGKIKTVRKNVDGVTISASYEVTDGVTTIVIPVSSVLLDPNDITPIIANHVEYLNANDVQKTVITNLNARALTNMTLETLQSTPVDLQVTAPQKAQLARLKVLYSEFANKIPVQG